MHFAKYALAALALSAAGFHSVAQAKPTVSFELVTEPGFQMTGSKDWFDLLTDLGIGGLTIRSATDRDEVTVEQVGRKEAPSYRVKGVLKANNTLYLPGGKFTLRDRAGIKKWIDDLSDQGIPAVTQQRSAFGLLPGQLVEVNDDMSHPLGVSTKGVSVQEVLSQCKRKLKFAIVFDAGTERELGQSKIAEELQGLSTGTALAAALRPAGLVLEPQRPANGQIQYRIGKPVSGKESWPVGWKPSGPNAKILPKRFESIEVEMNATPLPEALEALAERLKVPMLFDHNAMALHGADMSKVEVTLPAKKLSYSLIIQKILAQSKPALKAEVRQDEAGKPFYWITTVKPS